MAENDKQEEPEVEAPEAEGGEQKGEEADQADEVAPATSATITRIPYTAGSPIFVSAHIGGAGPVTLILDSGFSRSVATG